MNLMIKGMKMPNSCWECPFERCVLRALVDRHPDCPLVEADPVKHGRWVNDKGLYKCSECNELWTHWWVNVVPIERMNKIMKYCPNCGAKMDADEGTHYGDICDNCADKNICNMAKSCKHNPPITACYGYKEKGEE